VERKKREKPRRPPGSTEAGTTIKRVKKRPAKGSRGVRHAATTQTGGKIQKNIDSNGHLYHRKKNVAEVMISDRGAHKEEGT